MRVATAKEAFEEAGVVGYVSQSSVGMFRARRRSKNALSRQIIEVWVYLLEVKKTRRKWPEMQKRQTQWVSCEVAVSGAAVARAGAHSSLSSISTAWISTRLWPDPVWQQFAVTFPALNTPQPQV